jgi:hypothetical protein
MCSLSIVLVCLYWLHSRACERCLAAEGQYLHFAHMGMSSMQWVHGASDEYWKHPHGISIAPITRREASRPQARTVFTVSGCSWPVSIVFVAAYNTGYLAAQSVWPAWGCTTNRMLQAQGTFKPCTKRTRASQVSNSHSESSLI